MSFSGIFSMFFWSLRYAIGHVTPFWILNIVITFSAFLFPIAGLVVGIVGLVKAKKNGSPKKLDGVGVAVSAVNLLWVLLVPVIGLLCYALVNTSSWLVWEILEYQVKTVGWIAYLSESIVWVFGEISFNVVLIAVTVAFFVAGLIVGIIGLVRAKKTGAPKGFAIARTIVSIAGILWSLLPSGVLLCALITDVIRIINVLQWFM